MGKSPEMFPGREKTDHLFMTSRGWTKSGAKARLARHKIAAHFSSSVLSCKGTDVGAFTVRFFEKSWRP